MNQQDFGTFNSPFEPVKNAKYYRQKAWNKLSGHWGWAMLATLILLLLLPSGASLGFSISGDLAPSITQSDLFNGESISVIFFIFFAVIMIALCIVALLSMLVTVFVGYPVSIGYWRICLNIIDEKTDKIHPGILFTCFKRGYWKSVGLMFLLDLIVSGTMLPMFVCVLISSLIEILFGNLMFVLLGSLLTIMGAIISLCIFFPVYYGVCMSSMILADYPEIGVGAAIRSSWNMMNGNRWRLFCLNFSYIGWKLLSVLFTCGLGVYFVYPYQSVAVAAFYDDISNRHAGKDTEFPSLNPEDYQSQEL